MKLCKDCEHYQVLETRILWWRFTVSDAHDVARCGANLDPVSGRGAHFCTIERKERAPFHADSSVRCGPDATLFKPRTSRKPITL